MNAMTEEIYDVLVLAMHSLVDDLGIRFKGFVP